MKGKSKRGLVIGACVILISSAGLLMLGAMRENIVFFHTPAEILSGKIANGTRTRLGGLVEGGSIVRQPNGLDIAFRVTDGAKAMPVRYQGILPDLFREGQGVIAEGTMENGDFRATTILAKHDENYMPREIADTLKKD